MSLTLFIASIVIIVDLVTLILNFLEGELTSRFLLKNFSVLVVIGTIFGYYLNALKKQKVITAPHEKLFIWIVSLVVLASVLGSFFVIGSPFSQRLEKFDRERISNLQMIQNHIVNYFQQKEELPPTLEDLRDPLLGVTIPNDPVTNEPYEYLKTGEFSFGLCAVFASNSSSKEYKGTPRIEYPFMEAESEDWNHPEGHFCFERTIDPERIEKRIPVR